MTKTLSKTAKMKWMRAVRSLLKKKAFGGVVNEHLCACGDEAVFINDPTQALRIHSAHANACPQLCVLYEFPA